MYQSAENKIVDGVRYLSNPVKQEFDGVLYIKLRNKEGRLYTNDELKNLPDIKDNHPLKAEWKIRKKTGGKLVNYFSAFSDKNILEVGCGNGWLSNLIAENTNNSITALDLNEFELKQAASVFSKTKNLAFIYGNIFENIFTKDSFDIILLAGSIQYFSDFDKLVRQLFTYMVTCGEIHIVDSNFYKSYETEAAKLRTKNYYESFGFSEMLKFYYHHDWNQLKKYKHRLMNPYQIKLSTFYHSLSGSKRNIFPWIVITKI